MGKRSEQYLRRYIDKTSTLKKKKLNILGHYRDEN